jgi:hypothetical protein
MTDWAAKAAYEIAITIREASFSCEPEKEEVKKSATIIATFAEPLVALVRESKRRHYHCDDSFYCCPLCDESDHAGAKGTDCTCGADDWNARVNAVLEGTHDAR